VRSDADKSSRIRWFVMPKPNIWASPLSAQTFCQPVYYHMCQSLDVFTTKCTTVTLE